jgi:hypothetical protein
MLLLKYYFFVNLKPIPNSSFNGHIIYALIKKKILQERNAPREG